MLRKDEAFNKLYSILDESEKIITIGNFKKPKNVKGDVNGFFDPSTNNVSILNFTEGAVEGTVAEEMFHAYQDQFYGSKFAQELRGTTALETEAKLFRSQIKGNFGLNDAEARLATRGYSVAFNFALSQVTANYVSAIKGGGIIDSKIASQFKLFYQSQHSIIRKAYKSKLMPSDNNSFKIGAFKSLY